MCWFIFVLFVAAISSAAPSRAANEVAGELIVFNDNGAWSWFESERVIFDSERQKILLSSVANAQGREGQGRAGDIDVVSYDLATGAKQRFTLSNNLEEDDHDSAALLKLPDGRYLASYSKHAGDKFVRYRITRRPGDITAWQQEQIYSAAGPTTYSNLLYLSKPNTVFNFHRDSGRGFDPNYLRWDLSRAPGFRYGGHLLTGPEGNSGNSDRPYMRYATNGIDRIHFIATDHHPRNLFSNSVYHGYIQAERTGYGVYRSDGTRLGDLSTLATSPYKASDFTTLLAGDTISPASGLRMTRGWTIDIELDRSGNPSAVFTARVEDNDLDHRFFYGRYSQGGWQIHELAKAGGYLYESEADYTGLAALEPANPNRVFISTNIDPRTDRKLSYYEIFVGTTADDGATWLWSPVTYDSSLDNLRPVVPRGNAGSAIVVWMRGRYRSYTNYNSSIVGLTQLVPMNEITLTKSH
jgi:hypothetical protein